jgi:hypothetical protein
VQRELVASFFSTRGFEAHEGPKLTSVLKLKSASLRLGDFCIVIPTSCLSTSITRSIMPVGKRPQQVETLKVMTT